MEKKKIVVYKMYDFTCINTENLVKYSYGSLNAGMD